MDYYAIIGDIKESKEIIDRGPLQEKLKSVLQSVNTVYEKDIAARFLITLGDEFQGLLSKPEHLLEIIKLIQRMMYPTDIRFGIGIGDIVTRIDRTAAIGADGPAYYAARKTISLIREQEKKLKKQAADIQIAYYDKTCFELTEINTMLSLIKVIEDGWTEKQRYTIWDMIANQGSQEMCAKRMHTTQPTVARRMSEGKYAVYTNALQTLDEAVRRLGGKNDG